MPKLLELSKLPRTGRRSAFVILVGQTASKVADIACNAKTVLTWLMGVLGAPAELTALLVPIRESGSMLPQAFVSGLVKRVSRRKWVYVAGALGQTGALVAMAAAAVFLEGVLAGLAVLLALSLYSVARCFCSIASKDVIGKALPKGTRGRLTGLAAAISGIIGLIVALAGMFGVDHSASRETYGWLILFGAAFYLIAAIGMSLAVEERSIGKVKDLVGDFKGRMRLVWSDPVLGKFIAVRSLLLGSALASPYLVVLSQQQGFDLGSLAAFVLAGGCASALSSVLWGRLSDRSSRRAMGLGGLIT